MLPPPSAAGPARSAAACPGRPAASRQVHDLDPSELCECRPGPDIDQRRAVAAIGAVTAGPAGPTIAAVSTVSGTLLGQALRRTAPAVATSSSWPAVATVTA